VKTRPICFSIKNDPLFVCFYPVDPNPLPFLKQKKYVNFGLESDPLIEGLSTGKSIDKIIHTGSTLWKK